MHRGHRAPMRQHWRRARRPLPPPVHHQIAPNAGHQVGTPPACLDSSRLIQVKPATRRIGRLGTFKEASMVKDKAGLVTRVPWGDSPRRRCCVRWTLPPVPAEKPT